jgi:small redox-active disulfide protein 2
MKKIQILGSGCANCEKLTKNAAAAAEELGVAFELEKVTNLQEIMKFGVMRTPALVVDGIVKVVGKVPSIPEVKALLS